MKLLWHNHMYCLLQNEGPLTNYRSKIWSDMIHGLEKMYRFTAFAGIVLLVKAYR